MIATDLVQHLNNSGILTGYAYTDWRDDSQYPFSDDIKCCLIRVQGGPQDRDIGSIPVDVFLFTGKNATQTERGELMTTANLLDRYLTTSTVFGNVQHLEITGSAAGPYKDGHERYYTVHRITVKRSGV